MGSINLETSNFSEQLGIYDFFNVIISGAVFVFSLCAIYFGFDNFKNISIIEGLGIIFLIYIVGLLLQEIASLVDNKGFKFYKKMNRSIIKDTFDKNGEKKTSNDIIDNSLLIEQYRKYADAILCDLDGINRLSDLTPYNNEEANGFFFSVCQYYVAVNGKDKKVEKMRALYSMSKTLMVCFALVSLSSFLPCLSCDILKNVVVNDFLGIDVGIIQKGIIFFVFAIITYVFYLRTKRIMRYFLLILLGTYDAIIRLEKRTQTNMERKDYFTQKEYEKIKKLVGFALNATNKDDVESYIRKIESYGYGVGGKTSYLFNELVNYVRDMSAQAPYMKKTYHVRKKLEEIEKYSVRWNS